MSFYSEIAEYYDFIFPFNKAHVEFVKNCTERPYGGKTILDVGCGTGDLTTALTEIGFRVTGIDYDREMLAEAKKKEKSSVIFLQVDMRSLAAAFNPATFDAVLCFGNTLVHLSGFPEVEAFCRAVREVLKNKGKLLLQILNYDHVLDHGIRTLPLIENDLVRFERFYRHDDRTNMIAFKTKLFVKKTQKEIENEILLYPMRKSDLEAALRKTGFTNISFYGDFDKRELSEDSLPLVVEAQ
jgi:2-polyprenyl-3-methyl-5-hydroxy-6-metoxy-1,4-benzoquinol methylase